MISLSPLSHDDTVKNNEEHKSKENPTFPATNQLELKQGQRGTASPTGFGRPKKRERTQGKKE
jgi:hypothetical protein